jgi:hypothetical protein
MSEHFTPFFTEARRKKKEHRHKYCQHRNRNWSTTPGVLHGYIKKRNKICYPQIFLQEGHLKSGTFGINWGHRDILSKSGTNGNPAVDPYSHFFRFFSFQVKNMVVGFVNKMLLV